MKWALFITEMYEITWALNLQHVQCTHHIESDMYTFWNILAMSGYVWSPVQHNKENMKNFEKTWKEREPMWKFGHTTMRLI